MRRLLGLKTGASWHGPIGRARIVCDLGSVANSGPIWFQPASGRRKGRTITWDLRNFKPKEDMQIKWYRGFEDISINGHWLWKKDAKGDMLPDWDYSSMEPARSPAVAFQRGTVVWVPIRLAASWLDATLEREPMEGGVSLTRHGRRALFTVGRAALETEQGAVTLPGSVFERDGAIFIPLQAAVTTFGGESHFNASGGLLITLPK